MAKETSEKYPGKNHHHLLQQFFFILPSCQPFVVLCSLQIFHDFKTFFLFILFSNWNWKIFNRKMDFYNLLTKFYVLKSYFHNFSEISWRFAFQSFFYFSSNKKLFSSTCHPSCNLTVPISSKLNCHTSEVMLIWHVIIHCWVLLLFLLKRLLFLLFDFFIVRKCLNER